MIFKKYPVVVEVRINLHLLDGHEIIDASTLQSHPSASMTY